MAWRVSHYLIEGELDNTHLGQVTGWMRFAGMNETVTFHLEGDFHRDIRGAKIHLTGDASQMEPPADAQAFMEGFAVQQIGSIGDITAGLPPTDYVNYPYVEWYSQENGRALIELGPQQMEVIGTPIPACESDPISRGQQNRNMAEFLGELATELNLAKEHVVCVTSDRVIHAGARSPNHKVRGMKLLTKEIRKKLPPLYAQEGKGGKAVVHLKLFTPDGSFTWYITEGSPVMDDSGNEVDFHFFGLVDGLERELGYVALSELESVRGPLGLPVERDLWWELKPLEEIAPEIFRSPGRQTED